MGAMERQRERWSEEETTRNGEKVDQARKCHVTHGMGKEGAETEGQRERELSARYKRTGPIGRKRQSDARVVELLEERAAEGGWLWAGASASAGTQRTGRWRGSER